MSLFNPNQPNWPASTAFPSTPCTRMLPGSCCGDCDQCMANDDEAAKPVGGDSGPAPTTRDELLIENHELKKQVEKLGVEFLKIVQENTERMEKR